jgi:hypothetical protein
MYFFKWILSGPHGGKMNGKIKIIIILSGVIVLLVAGLCLSIGSRGKVNSDFKRLQNNYDGVVKSNRNLTERNQKLERIVSESGKRIDDLEKRQSDITGSIITIGTGIDSTEEFIDELARNNYRFEEIIEAAKY